MKGGGFIVFLFLLFCFLWGVTTVVGGIRRRMQAWTTPVPQPAPPRAAAKAAAPSTAHGQEPLVIDAGHTTASSSNRPKQTSDAMATTLASLREASELHRSGVLSDAEFAGIKAQLLKDPVVCNPKGNAPG